MEKAKALLAVILFFATLLFAFNTKETRPETKKQTQTILENSPGLGQDSSYILFDTIR
jgi:hypothetical protein